jgi:hypothetical protein
MKKLAPKKLTLSRETIFLLEEQNLKQAAGASVRTGCTFCVDSGCPNTCFC